MSLKDITYTRTCEGIDRAYLSVLEQRYYARRGIGIMIIGTILQIIAMFCDIKCKNFSVYLVVVFILITVFLLEERWKYKRDRKKCELD